MNLTLLASPTSATVTWKGEAGTSSPPYFTGIMYLQTHYWIIVCSELLKLTTNRRINRQLTNLNPQIFNHSRVTVKALRSTRIYDGKHLRIKITLCSEHILDSLHDYRIKQTVINSFSVPLVTRPVEDHSGDWGNILAGPPNIFTGTKFLNFSSQNGTFWHTLYF